MEDFLATALPRSADTVGHSAAVTHEYSVPPKFCRAQKNLFFRKIYKNFCVADGEKISCHYCSELFDPRGLRYHVRFKCDSVP